MARPVQKAILPQLNHLSSLESTITSVQELLKKTPELELSIEEIEARLDALVITGPVPSSRLVQTTLPLTGGGALSADLTLDINNATPATDGTMSAADKTKLDALPSTAPPVTRTLTAGAGLTGGGDLSANRTFDVVANADGSIVVNTNDIQVGVINDTQHGNRGNGALHSVATTSVDGFMSAADKTKLDRDESFESVAAAGTNASTATVLTKRSALVNSSTGTQGVRLTAFATLGRRQTVFNGALNDVIVYPPAGVTICDNTGAAVLTSWTLPVGATATFLWDLSSFVSVESQSGTLTAANLSGNNTGDVTIGSLQTSGTANALSLSGQSVRAHRATSANPGVVDPTVDQTLDDLTHTKTFGKLASTISNTASSWPPNASQSIQVLNNTASSSRQTWLAFAASGTINAALRSDDGGTLALHAGTSQTVYFFAGGTALYQLNSTGFFPQTDNSIPFGKSGQRASAVWAANGTIQTSDSSQKTDIEATPLGLDFIRALKPRQWRWREGGKTLVKVGERQVIDEVRDYSDEEVTEEVALLGDDGKERKAQLKKMVRVERVVEKERTVDVEEWQSRPGRRLHHGLLADEVQQALTAAGKTTADFGGFVDPSVEDPSDTSPKGLNYSQFIAPLVAAVQQLASDNDALRSRLEALERQGKKS